MDLEIEPRDDFRQNNTYPSEIPVVDSTISYKDFFNEYLQPNQACLIKNVATDWKSLKWSSNGNINYSYLHRCYGPSDVTVYDCNSRSYNSQECRSAKFHEYLVYWESYVESGYSDAFPLLYLKDWHLKEERGDDDFYEVPRFFASDWLNEYLVDVGRQDYRFVYMGPKGSWFVLYGGFVLAYLGIGITVEVLMLKNMFPYYSYSYMSDNLNGNVNIYISIFKIQDI